MIINYDTLKADIVSYLARSDVTSANPTISTDIALAEAYMDRVLRIKKMEKTVTLQTVVNQDYIDLPSDFLELKDVSGSCPIEYMSSTIMTDKGNGSGAPRYCTLSNNGANEALTLWPSPKAVYDVNVTYFAKIPALSDANTTNVILSHDPELYLSGALYYAFRRYRNPLAGEYLSVFKSKIMDMNSEQSNKDLGPSAPRMRPRGRVV